MRNFIFSLILLITSGCSLTGQLPGCSVSGSPDLSYFNLSSQGNQPDFTVKLYFNIVRDDNGNGGYDPTRIPNLTSILDNAFNTNGIFFEFVCDDIFYDNTERANNGALNSEWCTWFDVDNSGESIVPRHSDGVDIFIVSGFHSGSFSGRVSSIPGKFLVLNGGNQSEAVQNSKIESTTIIHELGHLFGLLHMSHGSNQNPNIWGGLTGVTCYENPTVPVATSCQRDFVCPTSSFLNCATGNYISDVYECAEDLSNGAVAGDYIPDTPPSHAFVESAFDIDCFFNPQWNIFNDPDQKPTYPLIVDPEGNRYDPDGSNYISTVGNKECRDHYTLNQWTVMKSHIGSHPKLADVISIKGEYTCDCDYDRIIYLKDDIRWSDVILSENLDPSALEDFEIIVESTLFLDVDYSFAGVNFTMRENAEIDIINNANISIKKDQNDKRSVLMTCDNRWRGIKVTSGSSLSFTDTDIYETLRAIDAENASSLIIDNVVFIEAAIYAIKIVGDVPMSYDRVKVIGATVAVFIKNSPQYYNITNSEISDADVGIYLINSSGEISGMGTSDVKLPIILYEAHESMIIDNSLGYELIGILIGNTIGGTIARNNIGTNFEHGEQGIVIRNSNHFQIRNNPKIIAEQFGIRGMQLFQVDIFNNDDISISGVQNTMSGGIFFTTATECDITDNYIYASEVAHGIESNNGTGNTIRNNYVSISSITNLFRSAAIRSVGSILEEIIENETYSSNNANGIMAQNTGFGLFNCNLIYDSHDALCIEHNSNFHQLITNHKINAHHFDFVTRSRLGIQLNEGNEYEGGSVRGFFATDLDRDESLFLVNETEPFHMPSDPIPDNNQWFRHNGQNDDFYSGSIGPGGQNDFFSSPNKVCDYWEDIKSLKNTEPQLFLVKLMHLIRFYDAQKSLNLPECISLDSVFINLCGLHTITDVIKRLSLNGRIKPNNSILSKQISNMSRLQNEYLTALSANDKQGKLNEIKDNYTQVRQSLNQEFVTKKSELNNIKDELSNINCNEQILQVMKDVWIKYIGELEEDIYKPNGRISDAQLEVYSRLCSDDYGDAIHLARSILSSQNRSIYYDEYDGCNDLVYSSPRSTVVEDF